MPFQSMEIGQSLQWFRSALSLVGMGRSCLSGSATIPFLRKEAMTARALPPRKRIAKKAPAQESISDDFAFSNMFYCHFVCS